MREVTFVIRGCAGNACAGSNRRVLYWFAPIDVLHSGPTTCLRIQATFSHQP